MFGLTVDDLFGALPGIAGIFGAGLYIVLRTQSGAPGTAPRYRPKRRILAMLFFGSTLLAIIVAYLVYDQMRYGTIFSVRTAAFVIVSGLTGVFYTLFMRLFGVKPKRST